MKTMNKVQKILIDFGRFSVSQLLSQANTIIASLTDFPEIPTPTPTIAVLQAAVDDLTDAESAAEVGGKQQKEIRDQKADALIALLKQEAAYVSMIADGDVAVMLGAGFRITKIPSPIGPLPKPVKFAVSSPQKGWLQLSLKAVYGAKNYQYEFKKVGDAQWTILASTRAKVIIQDLESAKEYVARVLPVGASEERTYSDEITAVVI
jgi:hypothetical protein